MHVVYRWRNLHSVNTKQKDNIIMKEIFPETYASYNGETYSLIHQGQPVCNGFDLVEEFITFLSSSTKFEVNELWNGVNGKFEPWKHKA